MIENKSKCKPGTPAISSQIVSCIIKQKALNNNFGIVTINGTDVAYFNYNNIYSYNVGDSVFCFASDNAGIDIFISGNLIPYPAGINKIAYNLHTPKKSLAVYGGPRKGTKKDLPPEIPEEGSNSNGLVYIFNDCGETAVMNENPNMANTWDRGELVVVGAHKNFVLYDYVGPTAGSWQP